MRIVITAALAALTAGTAWADPPDLPPGRGTITTEATARGMLANTVADVSIGVQAHAPTVAATQAALASADKQLMDYLRQQGVERLRTDRLSIRPHTVAEKDQPERIVGYDGDVQASFRVPADRLGAVVAGSLANGGNDLAGSNLVPREDELDAERGRLAAEAARIALAQAETVARATGRQLGAIRRIDVGPDRGLASPVPLRAMAVAAPAAMPWSTAAGDSAITASVTLTVELVEPAR